MSPKEETSNKTRQYMLIARIRDIIKAAVGPPEHPQIIAPSAGNRWRSNL